MPVRPARGGALVVSLDFELHWGVRDHVSPSDPYVANLLGELACGLLPWNPLAWWARARLSGLSELACDDWVIASGQSATDYAESLLGLVPQRRTAFALAAVSGRIGLAKYQLS